MIDKQIEKCIQSIKYLFAFITLIGSGFVATVKYAEFIIKISNEYLLNLIIFLQLGIIGLVIVLILVTTIIYPIIF